MRNPRKKENVSRVEKRFAQKEERPAENVDDDSEEKQRNGGNLSRTHSDYMNQPSSQISQKSIGNSPMVDEEQA